MNQRWMCTFVTLGVITLSTSSFRPSRAFDCFVHHTRTSSRRGLSSPLYYYSSEETSRSPRNLKLYRSSSDTNYKSDRSDGIHRRRMGEHSSTVHTRKHRPQQPQYAVVYTARSFVKTTTILLNFVLTLVVAITLSTAALTSPASASFIPVTNSVITLPSTTTTTDAMLRDEGSLLILPIFRNFIMQLLPTWWKDPVLQAEMFNDLAHVGLDLFALFGPTTFWQRFAAVVGRVAAIAADYVPDHWVSPEELVFQMFMLAISWTALIRTAVPLTVTALMASSWSGLLMASSSSNQNTQNKFSSRDGKAYLALFGPTGMTWKQYQALRVYAMDWITVAPGHVITITSTSSWDDIPKEQSGSHDEYTYWLYSGNITVLLQGSTSLVNKDSPEKQQQLVYTAHRQGHGSALRNNIGLGWIGETRLLRPMDESTSPIMMMPPTNPVASTSSVEITEQSTSREAPSTTGLNSSSYVVLASGDRHSTLLRIDTRSLKILLDSDPDLARMLRTLMFQGLQAKFEAIHLHHYPQPSTTSMNHQQPYKGLSSTALSIPDFSFRNSSHNVTTVAIPNGV